MKTPRGISESSTTSDNTSEFIEIVKRFQVVYDSHNQDYKNVEVKMKVWSQIAEEIGLSVEASKRKWKNLRDSYTKYLRSFRIGTKTSKKYQYWAHADHMEFLKPYQGPGRNSANNGKANDDDESECDLGFQVLAKATTSDEDMKTAISSSASAGLLTAGTTPISTIAASGVDATFGTTSTATTPTAAASNGGGALPLPVPSLPTVQLPPLACKPLLAPISSASATHIFSLPSLVGGSATAKAGGASIPIPTTSTSSSVGCLILEPQLFAAAADSVKKELNLGPSLGLLHNIAAATTTAAASTTRANPPLITKIRRVQPSLQAAGGAAMTTATTTTASNGPPAKMRKLQEQRAAATADMFVDVSAILQAARELDANTLFFLSLARTVRGMPIKYQTLAKMRCMRLVSDMEATWEMENNGINGGLQADTPPPATEGATGASGGAGSNDAAGTEHFVYVMSPSRVESMIDISSDEDGTQNGN